MCITVLLKLKNRGFYSFLILEQRSFLCYHFVIISSYILFATSKLLREHKVEHITAILFFLMV